jgi:hypothetical protein
MTYTVQEQYTSKNSVAGADANSVWGLGPRKVTSITIHHWGLKGQQFDTVRDFLCTNNSPTSAHYVAEDGLVACIVSPDDCAFHAGNPEGNTFSVGIECRPEATDGDYATVAELIANIRSIYGDVPLYPHNHWFNTACPGDYDLARLDSLARSAAAVAPQSTTITPEDDMPTLDEIFNHPIPRAGGRPGTTTLGAFVAYWDANNDNTRKMINAINPYVHSLVVAAVAQILGKTASVDPAVVQAAVAKAVAATPAPGVDPVAIAKAVNDDAASRRQNWK